MEPIPSTPKPKDKRTKLTPSSRKIIFKKAQPKFDLNLPFESIGENFPSFPGIMTINQSTQFPKGSRHKLQGNMQSVDAAAMNMSPNAAGKLIILDMDDDWTEQEHQSFLTGLIKYGKGNWKKISKKFVKSKDPKQVHAHAVEVFKNYPWSYSSFPSKTKRHITSANYSQKASSAASDPTMNILVEPAGSSTSAAESAITTGVAKKAVTIAMATPYSPKGPPLIQFPVASAFFPVSAATSSLASSSAVNEYGRVGTALQLALPPYNPHLSTPFNEPDLELRLG